MKFANFNEFLNEKREQADKILMIDDEENKEISYLETIQYANKTAQYLQSLGLKKGDKISIILPNCSEYIFILFGTLKLGSIFNPVNPNLTPDELSYIINNAGSSIIITDNSNIKKIQSIKDKLSKIKHIISLETYLASLSDATESFNEPKNELDDEAILMYSSGTTGNPKGILLTQGNILYEMGSIARRLGHDENTRALQNAPLFFSGGLFLSFLSNIHANGCIVLTKKFSKSQFWQRIEKYQVTWTFVVPTMLSILLNQSEDPNKYDLSQFKFAVCGSAPLPPEVKTEFSKIYNFPVSDAYGLTENTAVCSLTPPDAPKEKILSAGKTLDICELKVVDNQGKEVSFDTEGEILIKGTNMFKGYLNNEGATKKALQGGWLYSGDLGYLDEDGYVYIKGRKKEIIIKGGQNISPVAVDAVFYKHQAIEDAATIGIPDKIYGEEIKTFIVLKEGKTTNEEELMNFCKQHIEEFKCPKNIEFIEEIPKGPSGKLLRRKLLEMHLKSS